MPGGSGAVAVTRMDKIIAQSNEMHKVLKRCAVSRKCPASKDLASHLVFQAELGSVVLKQLQDGCQIIKYLVSGSEIGLQLDDCIPSSSLC